MIFAGDCEKNLSNSLQLHDFLLSDLVLLWALGRVGYLIRTPSGLALMSFRAGLSIEQRRNSAGGLHLWAGASKTCV